jgi:hypothetical protein
MGYAYCHAKDALGCLSFRMIRAFAPFQNLLCAVEHPAVE